MLLFIYEYVWRTETGMNTYSINMQRHIYSVWKKYYTHIKNLDCHDYIKEWFFIGMALLREFREDCKSFCQNLMSTVYILICLKFSSEPVTA